MHSTFNKFWFISLAAYQCNGSGKLLKMLNLLPLPNLNGGHLSIYCCSGKADMMTDLENKEKGFN